MHCFMKFQLFLNEEERENRKKTLDRIAQFDCLSVYTVMQLSVSVISMVNIQIRIVRKFSFFFFFSCVCLFAFIPRHELHQ